MRRRLNVLLLCFLATSVWGADGAWRNLNDPTSAQVAAGFPSPPPEYGMALWWGWDGPVTEEVIIRDLDDIKALGFPAVLIEAGYEMKAPYLSDGWFENVRVAVEQAARRGMRVWIEDEGKYPSGFAGGKFSLERPDLRMQGLALAERLDVKPGQALTRQVSPQTVGALAVNLEDNGYLRLPVKAGGLRWTAPRAGKWQVWIVDHQFRTSDTRAVRNATRGKDKANSLCDYLNPEATRQFISWTHEQYKRAFGAEFGHTFLGFMGDEPDFAYVPWTPQIVQEFQKRKGYDVAPYLAAFFAPRPDDKARRAKADYWDVWSDLFRDNFFKIQADWCAANGVEYMVHLNHEDEMAKLARSEGDYFKDMRPVEIPGIDSIWNQIWPGKIADFPKLASSAAHLFGRPRAFTESFAAYRTRPNLEQGKWVIDHQLVRGINLVQIMFYPSSAARQRRPSGWMADPRFPDVARYVNRSVYLLAQGRPAAKIALYLPTTSLWLGDDEANVSAWSVARSLLERQRDFDFVDEQALSSLLKLDGPTLMNPSGQSYHAVIVPSSTAISKRALRRLRAFAEAGGRVVFLGRPPSLEVDRTFLEASAPARLDWAVSEPSGELTAEILAKLPRPDVLLDRACPAVKCLHRRWADAELYFFFNESETAQSFIARLEGRGTASFWDAQSGVISQAEAPSAGEEGRVAVRLDLAPYETRFVVAAANQERLQK